MRKENTIILVGLLTFAVPFLGVPNNLKTLLSIIFGLLIALLGILVRSDFKRIAAQKAKRTDAFAENGAGNS